MKNIPFRKLTLFINSLTGTKIELAKIDAIAVSKALDPTLVYELVFHSKVMLRFRQTVNWCFYIRSQEAWKINILIRWLPND